jgi:hypothetical protein
MPSDGARTARLIALMAAHAYVFVKIVDHAKAFFTPTEQHPWTTLTLAVIPAVGLALTYIALCAIAGSRAARLTENASLFLITALVSIFFAAAAVGGLGLFN